MSTKSGFLKSAAAIGAAGIGLGAVIYEAALNVRLSAKVGRMLNFNDPEQEEIDRNDYCQQAGEWWDAHEKSKISLEDKDGNTIYAIKIPADCPSDKWAIIVHGYTSGPGGMRHYAMEYNKRGYNCILPALRGHSMDPNHYCSMGWYDKDMVVNWAYYIALENPDSQIVIHGESMGAATTMLATGEKLPENVKAAVSDCGYTNVMEQFSSVLKSKNVPPKPLLPIMNVYSNLIGNFDFNKCSPIDAISHSVTPTLFVHGDRDDFVPFENLDKVYERCSAPIKDKFFVHGAVHASSSNLAPDYYWENVDKFLAGLIK